MCPNAPAGSYHLHSFFEPPQPATNSPLDAFFSARFATPRARAFTMHSISRTGTASANGNLIVLFSSVYDPSSSPHSASKDALTGYSE
jgi:hypothetical protein